MVASGLFGYGEQLLMKVAGAEVTLLGEMTCKTSDQVNLGAALQMSVTCWVPAELNINVVVVFEMPSLRSQRYVTVVAMSTVIEPVKVKLAPVQAPVYGEAGCTTTPTLTEGVAVRVGVLVGVLVGVFGGVLVGVFVGVAVRVEVGVLVGVFVEVGVFVGVAVVVGVHVLVGVGVHVLVVVGVGVGPTTVRINSLLL